MKFGNQDYQSCLEFGRVGGTIGQQGNRGGGMKRFRWFFFTIAVLSIVTFPFDFITSMKAVKEAGLLFILPISVFLRVWMTWMFLKIWWKHRPSDSNRPTSEI
jgi:hypothetical protein